MRSTIFKNVCVRLSVLAIISSILCCPSIADLFAQSAVNAEQVCEETIAYLNKVEGELESLRGKLPQKEVFWFEQQLKILSNSRPQVREHLNAVRQGTPGAARAAIKDCFDIRSLLWNTRKNAAIYEYQTKNKEASTEAAKEALVNGPDLKSSRDQLIGEMRTWQAEAKAVGDQGWMLAFNRQLEALFGAGTELTAQVPKRTPNPSQLSVKAHWQLADSEPENNWRIEGLEKAILPVRYAPQREIWLVVNVDDAAASPSQAEDPELGVDMSQAAVRVTVINSLSRPAWTLRRELKPDFSSQGIAVIRFNVDELLKETGTLINQNALEARVAVRWEGMDLTTTQTDNLVHILRQKLILFIPGVCGSRITVASHPEREAYPEWSWNSFSSNIDSVLTVPLNWLHTRRDGSPASHAVQLSLFKNAGLPGIKPLAVYNIDNRDEVKNPPNHPRLFRSGERNALEYYVVKAWPYDWRSKLEIALDLLMGRVKRSPDDPVWPPYQTPPPLTTIIEKAKEAYPFLDDRIAIASHSTGGLVTRAILHQPGIENLVDKAFFIDVPFWGAPKAYYVYLTGHMGLPFIKDRFMRDLSPNLPIVYYLAPTERFPETVARVGYEDFRRFPNQRVSSFMNKLINDAKEKGLYPKDLAPWNEELERAANEFHRSIQGEPQIGYKNSIVFWSDSKDNETPGIVTIVSRTNALPPLFEHQIIFKPTVGDSTVPVVSQRADFTASSLVKIVPPTEHVPTPNTPFVWKRIIEILSKSAANE